MNKVTPKKHLGQHFLRNESIAKRIAESITLHKGYSTLIEVGPGTGVLSKYLFENEKIDWWGIDVDTESVEYLREKYPHMKARILEHDFLELDLPRHFPYHNIGIIGNFPYNISSQILFKLLENREMVAELVGMFQKEVAMRVVAGPGGKVNGILSILCQAFYTVEYLFQVDESEFIPPPKVKSAVIRLKRNPVRELPCNEKWFFTVVKTAFNQRRKTLRNSLKPLGITWENDTIAHLSGKRAEELTVNDFVNITLSVNQL